MILHIVALEAYDGGSHGEFLDGLIESSRHEYTRIGLPPRKWKWRMRGSAIFFAQQLAERIEKRQIDAANIDLLFTSDMTAVADLRALLPAEIKSKPIVCYFHENQLTYPLEDESQRDYQYGFTNITSCLAAESLWFNSRYHLENFLSAVSGLLSRMPDFVPAGIAENIRNRSSVMPLGLVDEVFACANGRKTVRKNEQPPPTVLWNHRWEYDKNPDEFFEALFDLDRMDIPFRLIVLGQSFRSSPAIFEAAKKRLAGRIDHFGYLADRSSYFEKLAASDIVVSTAVHEFFGLSVLEAIAAGCVPILPRRLSYPELIPAELHNKYLYDDTLQLRKMLVELCGEGVSEMAPELRKSVDKLAWPRLALRYDSEFESVVTKNCQSHNVKKKGRRRIDSPLI